MNRQIEILRSFNQEKDLVLTKKQIIEKAKIRYFANISKHAGDTLTRMVANGSLIRVKRGHYKLGSSPKKTVQVPKNQIKLFQDE